MPFGNPIEVSLEAFRATHEYARLQDRRKSVKTCSKNFSLFLYLLLVMGMPGLLPAQSGSDLVSSGKARFDAEDYKEAFRLWKLACTAGKSAGCSGAGILLIYGAGTDIDHAQAALYLERSCTAGNAAGCGMLGFLSDIEKNYSHAALLYRKGCDGEFWEACSRLGYLYIRGRTVGHDPVKALDLFRKACDHDEAMGCMRLGATYASGSGTGKPDHNTAYGLYEKACNGKNGQGCMGQAWYFRYGTGGKQSNVDQANKLDQLAAAYMTTECNRSEATSCVSLGELFDYGFGVEKNANRAAQLYQQGCDEGAAYGCSAIAEKLINASNPDYTSALPLVDEACREWEGWGCYLKGFLYLNGKGVTADRAKAVELFARSCDVGVGAGCGALASIDEQVSLISDSIKLYQKSCDLSYGDGCASIGKITGNGSPFVLKDAFKSLELFLKACRLQSGEGCAQAGYLYDGNAGITRDATKLIDFSQKACELGNALGCLNIAKIFRQGDGADIDMAKAFIAADKSCSLGGQDACDMKKELEAERPDWATIKLCAQGLAYSCWSAGDHFEFGFGVSRNPTLALQFYHKACELKFKEGCKGEKRLR
jgi:TPR repeat protein